MVDGLKLTQSQRRERIRGIEEEFNLTQMREMSSTAASGDNARRRVSRSVSTIEGILSLLTAEQLKLWNDLAGSPIQGPLRPVPMSFRLIARQESPAWLTAISPRVNRPRRQKNRILPHATRSRIASITLEARRATDQTLVRGA